MEPKYVVVDIKTDDEVGVIVQSITGYDDKGNVIEQDYSSYEGEEYSSWDDCQYTLAEELGLDEEDVRQGTAEPLLDHVIVTFEIREEQSGVMIIQSVKGYDSDENEIHDYQDYVGVEFPEGEDGEWWDDCQTYLSARLGISSDDVWKADEEDYEYTPSKGD